MWATVGRRTMAGKILKSILAVTVSVLMASLVVVTGVLYQYFGGVQQSQLKDELSLAASATEILGKSYLEKTDSSRYRLTWVDSDGSVLFDNHASTDDMENHINREEINEALVSGTGSSSRYSSTLTEQTIYEAVRLSDGTVLRISVSRFTALVLVLGMLQPILFIIFVAIIISVWLAGNMAKKVVEPLNNLDLENPMDNDVYEELSPLLCRIHSQHLQIENQMRVLEHKKEEFEQITHSMKEALVLLDDSGRIISINPAAVTLFDAKQSCVGEDFLLINRRMNMQSALQTAREQGHAQFCDSIKGKEYRFDLSRIDSDGKTQGTVILAFDISEQVNAEKHRREFTANVSHELKTPLQSIIGSAELMENGIVRQEDIPRFTKRIRNEASRLVSLIDDIIRLSELDEGIDIPREDVSLLSLAEEICETLSDAARMKNVSLEVCGDAGVIHGVRGLLYEIIYNLCDNAVKYNNQGGSVKVTVTDKPGEVRLVVSDTGIGIPPEHLDKVFERFYRVDKSHSRNSGGTGLGLSIVKHAVQYHRGKISMQSEPGKGTAVCVVFPQSE